MPGSNGTIRRVRWHNSLVVRVMALCVILLLCLLGTVYVLTGHFYQQVVREMERETQDIVQYLEVELVGKSDGALDIAQLNDDLQSINENVVIDLRPAAQGGKPRELDKVPVEGGYAFTSTQTVLLHDTEFILTTRFQLNPQTELLRAFKNRSMVALTIAFSLTLAFMVYLIARTLRPLRELSESCADISEGKLSNVSTSGGSGEIIALEETFNRMVASLREKEIVETNLRQAQRLSAIGNLAAGVAHDVRNPLNAIKLISSHALDTLEDNPQTTEAVKQLKTIRNEVNRLEEIVSGFLSLAKEEELRREPCGIDPVLDECVRLIQKDAEARGIRFASELRAGDTSLMLDRKQWTRAILNVLINALEACPPGGRVRLFSRVTDRACEVEIRDDGPGMARETKDRAFDPYYTTKATGTGLGLSITRGIIEEHGGTIVLSSSEGSGSQVLITLPLDLPSTAPAEPIARN